VCQGETWQNRSVAQETSALDRIDREILGALRSTPGSSWRELGERVHLSPTSVADRVRRLERDGVIQGYTVRVDPAALGRTVRAVVDVSLGSGDQVDRFEAALAEREEVTFAAYVTGTADYSINVECEGAEGWTPSCAGCAPTRRVARTETKLLLRVVAG
jgi:Lrp/AsnC family transcriptional regulator, leucine-responsive regulatory protein